MPSVSDGEVLESKISLFSDVMVAGSGGGRGRVKKEGTGDVTRFQCFFDVA